jgi:hypothetical protein
LAGDVEFDEPLVAALGAALAKGSSVLIAPRHRLALADRFDQLSRRGHLEVLEPWLSPGTGRPVAISDGRLKRIVRDLLPFEVSGDPVQFAVNRTAGGWVIELVNNDGVIKQPDRPTVLDPNASRKVTIKLKVASPGASRWRSGQRDSDAQTVQITLAPGQTEFVQF